MRSPREYLRGIRHPEGYHGRGRRGGYFEGWYVKLVSADLRQRWAVIPGIFRADAPDAESEAFIQVLDGLTGRSWYHAYPADDFAAAADRFAVRVGASTFDAEGIALDLPTLRGTVAFTSPLTPYPITLRAPGIMGWYGYVPAMECSHGIVSFEHSLAGTLATPDGDASFDGGRGYIEKDWGSAFPSSYVWLASNHLRDTDGAEMPGSLSASCAIIPGVGRTFRGAIVALRLADVLRTWATWNGSKDRRLTIDDHHVRWVLTGPDGTLELRAERTRGGLLHTPLRTAMHRRVEETLDASVEILLSSGGEVIFRGTGDCAGMEVFGDTDRLLRLG